MKLVLDCNIYDLLAEDEDCLKNLTYLIQHEGWKVDSTFDQVAIEQSTENTMFYVRQGRECTIRVGRDKNSGHIITTIVEGQQKT